MNGLADVEGDLCRSTVPRASIALMMLDNGSGCWPISPFLIDRMTGDKRLSLTIRKAARNVARSPKGRVRGVVSVRPFTVKARPEVKMPYLAGDRTYKVLAMTRNELMVADDRNRIVWVDRDDVLYANGESA
jgi:hypothetical protein